MFNLIRVAINRGGGAYLPIHLLRSGEISTGTGIARTGIGGITGQIGYFNFILPAQRVLSYEAGVAAIFDVCSDNLDETPQPILDACVPNAYRGCPGISYVQNFIGNEREDFKLGSVESIVRRQIEEVWKKRPNCRNEHLRWASTTILTLNALRANCITLRDISDPTKFEAVCSGLHEAFMANNMWGDDTNNPDRQGKSFNQLPPELKESYALIVASAVLGIVDHETQLLNKVRNIFKLSYGNIAEGNVPRVADTSKVDELLAHAISVQRDANIPYYEVDRQVLELHRRMIGSSSSVNYSGISYLESMDYVLALKAAEYILNKVQKPSHEVGYNISARNRWEEDAHIWADKASNSAYAYYFGDDRDGLAISIDECIRQSWRGRKYDHSSMSIGQRMNDEPSLRLPPPVADCVLDAVVQTNLANDFSPGNFNRAIVISHNRFREFRLWGEDTGRHCTATRIEDMPPDLRQMYGLMILSGLSQIEQGAVAERNRGRKPFPPCHG